MDRFNTYKLIQSSCALGWNRGTTDHRVTIIYAFLLNFSYTPMHPIYPLTKTSHVLVPVTYALVCFRGTTRHRDGRRRGRLVGRQTQSCGCVRCNSKWWESYCMNRTLGRDTACGRLRTTLAQWFDDVWFVGKCLIHQNVHMSRERDVMADKNNIGVHYWCVVFHLVCYTWIQINIRRCILCPINEKS